MTATGPTENVRISNGEANGAVSLTYAWMQPIPDNMDEVMLDHMRGIVVLDWEDDAMAHGYVPLPNPTVTVDRALFPIFITLDDGTTVKLPERQIRVEGQVIRS